MDKLHEDERPLRGVVIGGGSGSPASIRSLLSLGVETSCVVAMADDGGSTGLLREEADVTPPGDIRKCLVSMASDPDDSLVKAFGTRFEFGNKHALGNLVLVALEQTTGSFPEAISVCEQLLDARGKVYPSTLTHVRLKATTQEECHVDGQATASHSDIALKKIWLCAEEPIVAYQPALDAILQADLVVLGPGSLFTSIIPNLVVPGFTDAIRQSGAKVLFVCGVADEEGESKRLSVLDHVTALYEHGMEGLIDYMLVHDSSAPDDSDVRRVSFTDQEMSAIEEQGIHVILRDVASREEPHRHDIPALTTALSEVLGFCRSR